MDPVSPCLNTGCYLHPRYFGQVLNDYMEQSGDKTPIGLIDTAIGGQRIEEYMVNTTEIMYSCANRTSATPNKWDGMLFARMILPYVDMTTKGFAWYQVSRTRVLHGSL